MLLCDIGNFSAKFYDNGKAYSMDFEKLNNLAFDKKVYFINVNKNFYPNSRKFINIESYFNFDTNYIGLGVDRIAGCYTIKDGVVVDAGSAITIDIMKDGMHLGGYIVPGISKLLKNYEDISPILKTYFNSQINLDKMPQKTSDAINYGIISPIILSIQNISKDKNLYFTGGDGSFFAKFFTNSIYDKNLIFRGMLKAIKEKELL
ncbi:type III pantothenate kinase [Campylobacter blaseri]|uniref:Type III pantothenate kinase n=1 Tax=Campylobacter blaseri TaxID=2042961 RepID=A0A2P8R1E8_9BACT|nr:type III pantothenate kinase [Campylobacter blaseri]PSM52320.1 pantothenate kinase [Campylobacter blaseri]PSM54086.1 pantothenate kinase [Campylobacter blaseri]